MVLQTANHLVENIQNLLRLQQKNCPFVNNFPQIFSHEQVNSHSPERYHVNDQGGGQMLFCGILLEYNGKMVKYSYKYHT